MIILINGTLNTGKSTLAKALASKLPRLAYIELDTWREFVTDVPLDEAIVINLENLVLDANNFTKHKIDSVVPYPLSKKNLEIIKNGLIDKDLRIFTLDPGEQCTLSTRGERQLDDWERERIKHHYKTGELMLDEGITIDNSEITVDETVTIICEKIQITPNHIKK